MFAVLFVRLWALQVLSGNEFLVAAQNNQLRLLRLDAPRGPIEDRNGRVLVQNTNATAVKIWPADLPKHGAYQELRRLSRILEVPLADVTAQIKKNRGDPLAPVTVKDAVNEGEVHYLLEHQTEFPGMTITNTYVRQYPLGDLAAHILGYVGPISEDQLKTSKGYTASDKIGQGGIEAAFDKELRGPARSEPASRGLPGAPDQPDRAERADDPRLRGPPYARHEAPARGTAGRHRRDQPRAGQSSVVRESRRDRRARPT